MPSVTLVEAQQPHHVCVCELLVLNAVWPAVCTALAQHHQVRLEDTHRLQQLGAVFALCEHAFDIS